ncbi:hypothetical protein [Algicola sagamiensis]|uniref:hypothetical protein n=1 Tax=Algicola sagamiensis TaxID=163869 RepID=UPI00036D5CA2|nr:hypothetical protein [Algicola sagamiensis]
MRKLPPVYDLYDDPIPCEQCDSRNHVCIRQYFQKEQQLCSKCSSQEHIKQPTTNYYNKVVSASDSTKSEINSVSQLYISRLNEIIKQYQLGNIKCASLLIARWGILLDD